MEKFFKRIVIFLATLLIGGTILAFLAFAGYIVWFLFSSVFHHRG